MLNYAAHALRRQAGWGFGDGMFYDERVRRVRVRRHVATATREMVEYFRGLVEDGLLDPESFTAAERRRGGDA